MHALYSWLFDVHARIFLFTVQAYQFGHQIPLRRVEHELITIRNAVQGSQ